jgi:hypothetical protein
MTTAECNTVQKPYTKYCLNKIGVVSTAPPRLAVAPYIQEGFGSLDTFGNQTIDRVQILLQHDHTNTITGQLVRISLEYLALEAGTIGDPMQIQVRDTPWIKENT